MEGEGGEVAAVRMGKLHWWEGLATAAALEENKRWLDAELLRRWSGAWAGGRERRREEAWKAKQPRGKAALVGCSRTAGKGEKRCAGSWISTWKCRAESSDRWDWTNRGWKALAGSG